MIAVVYWCLCVENHRCGNVVSAVIMFCLRFGRRHGSINWTACHHVTCALIGTSRKLAAYNCEKEKLLLALSLFPSLKIVAKNVISSIASWNQIYVEYTESGLCVTLLLLDVGPLTVDWTACHHVTCALIGTSRKLAAYNYVSSLTLEQRLSTSWWIQAGVSKRSE